TNFGFEIKSFNSTTHEYTLNIQVNYSGVVAMPPSKPQILPITLAGFRNPKIYWSGNIESDLSYYKIYRKIGLGSWQFIATRYPPSTYYIDYEIEVSGLPSAKNIKYKIIAVDTQAKSSVYSDEVACKGLNELLPKKNSDEGESVEITSEYLLKQNYPNPFNPSTEITFSLKESANVKIVVFNSLGEEVVVLINSVIPAGYHSIEFKADNLPSGIYYYEMRAGDFREIKKMVLLR
ncbi:MAG: T9SS type A sorting domain-containing protein, partial [Melioribacteraceae bacterium]|nr:T9SS type A sorting domain-containing protein [Melioribacteraceae bacterium]